ncbi:MAG: B12-binding domain-containing radical SAM protein [Planctomycetes bacterium]|nr:B12-binding domain-containing radical SAM protein [Planctomycetota bacterium]
MKAKTNILLIQAPPWSVSMPPLGLSFIIGALKETEANVDVLDLNEFVYTALDLEDAGRVFARFSHEAWDPPDKSLEAADLMRAIRGFFEGSIFRPPDVIGISAIVNSFPWVREPIRMLREMFPDAVVVIGGPAASFRETRAAIGSGVAHWMVEGEGERVMKVLAERRPKRAAPGEYDGIVVFEENGLHDAMVAYDSRLPETKDLPIPDFSEFDPRGRKYKVAPILFSRGCVRRCTFCNDIKLWPKFRAHPSDHMTRQIRIAIERYAIRTFDFADLALNANPKALFEFASAIVDERLDIEWGANAIFRRDMSAEFLAALKKSGARCLIIGLESGSDRVVEAMAKGFDIDTAKMNLRLIKAAGIETHLNLVLGYPGETDEEFRETLVFLSENRELIDRISNINECYLAPGTAIKAKAVEEGWDEPFSNGRDWSDPEGKSTPEIRAQRYEDAMKHLETLAIPAGAMLPDDR